VSASPAAACRRRDTCRLCGGKNLVLAFSLAPTPPANAFVPEAMRSRPQERYPLDVFFCESCTHVQLLDVVDPRLLFEDYVYVSGTSPMFVRHFQDYAEHIAARFALAPGSLVVDIGSNDGTLLAAFKDRDMTVLGIDPAVKIAEAATVRGLETIPAFFTPALAKDVRARRGPAAIVTANNVFAHVDDLASIVAGVQTLIEPAGVFVFEVSYLVDVYEKTLFDTIYHEHLSYHSVTPLRAFFAAHGMDLIAVERIDTHGGSIRGMAQTAGGPWPPDGSVTALIALEERLGLDRADTLKSFARKIEALGEELSALLHRLKADSRTIAGFGAPAKATTLMYQFRLGPDIVDFIVDDSPLKQGLYTPGYHIPVLPSSALYKRRPDYVLVLAWNFAEPIIAKHADFRAAGGRFIVPLPRIEIR
jgi:SAM-dependent methyltransferase